MFLINSSTDKRKAYALAGSLFLCGLALGGSVAALALDAWLTNQAVTGQDVLAQVKEEFEKKGPIEGSWVEMNPRSTQRFGQEQLVIFGGISRKEDGHLVQYEFIADAKSGNIISLAPLT